ncbi:hypothetical protein CYMTET_34541, partial [Cymbomonas tetramitiformis]
MRCPPHVAAPCTPRPLAALTRSASAHLPQTGETSNSHGEAADEGDGGGAECGGGKTHDVTECVERLPGVSTSVTCAEGGDTDMGTGNPGPNSQQEAYVELDAAALKNLEVLENSEGGAEGTLLAHLDHCVTAAGRRRLKQWLCRPLRHAASIAERQAAVVELRGKAFEAAQAARTHLRRAPDLPRLLARLQAACTGGTGRSSAHVVLYEDHSRKRLMDFLIALRGLESIKAAALEFRDVLDDIASPKLCALVTS